MWSGAAFFNCNDKQYVFCVKLFFMDKSILLIITAFLCFSCSSDRPSTTAVDGTVTQTSVAPRYTLELLPKNPTRKSTVQLLARGFNAADAKIEWQVNGRPFTTLSPVQFDGADAAKGATIQAKATIDKQKILSDKVQIMNAPPEIVGMRFIPDVIKPGDVLGVEVVGNDVDGDGITMLYEWTLNGAPAGNGQSIVGTLKRGDEISARVTPYDGESYGSSVVMNRQIANWPPVFIENNKASFDGSVYTYQAKASDPDGDALTFTLASAQTGMTIDPSSGLLTWVVPPDFNGTNSVTLIVSDGHGGTSNYTVEISIH